MEEVKCDRCNELILENERTVSILFGFMVDTDGEPANDISGVELELCKKCTKGVNEFLDKVNKKTVAMRHIGYVDLGCADLSNHLTTLARRDIIMEFTFGVYECPECSFVKVDDDDEPIICPKCS